MSVDQLVSLRRLDHCYLRLGLFLKAPLFVAGYASGTRALVYPVYASRGGSPVYVTVSEL